MLTWTMLTSRGIVQYEPVALAFTSVPERFGQLIDPALSLGARGTHLALHGKTRRLAAGSPEADEGTRTLDLLHGKQTL